MAYKIVIDAGHGGNDPGATFEGRQEKNDALTLSFLIGRLLENAGVDVEYTRVTDIFNSPNEKAAMANNAGADLFISVHRNASGTKNKAAGIETLLFDNTGIKKDIATNINQALADIGFRNRGIKIRPDLAVLRKTSMPALLIEVGFIDNENDNRLFDENINDIAEAISGEIINTLGLGNLNKKPSYRILAGEFDNLSDAYSLRNRLKENGFDSFIIS